MCSELVEGGVEKVIFLSCGRETILQSSPWQLVSPYRLGFLTVLIFGHSDREYSITEYVGSLLYGKFLTETSAHWRR